MVLTSHPFSLSVSPSNFFAACGTFMTWSCTASHFFEGSLGSTPHFYGRSFGVRLHFYGRTYSNPKMHKHEENTKKRRRKHERYTQFFVFFVQTEDKTIGRKQPDDLWKISGLNWTTEKQRVKMSLWSGWKPTTPLRAKMARGYKLYRRLRRGGTQKCHLIIFSKNLLTKSDLCVILL